MNDKLGALDRQREILSYRATLSRGYAVVRGDGARSHKRAEAEKANSLEIEY